MSRENYPNLYRFFAGYLNEMFPDIYIWEDREMSYERIVKLFLHEANETQLAATTKELEQLIGHQHSEEVLHSILRKLGSGFRPQGVDLTYQKWLENILELFEENNTDDYVRRII